MANDVVALHSVKLSAQNETIASKSYHKCFIRGVCASDTVIQSIDIIEFERF